jgi:hypothetical protein
MTQASLLDWRQDSELARVSSRIALAVLSFCRSHAGEEFFADDLRAHVAQACGKSAPDSASRVLRDLRAKGLVSFEVVNRAQSRYRLGGAR